MSDSSGWAMSDREHRDRMAELRATLAGSVWISPQLRGGLPCVGGTRVPAFMVAELYDAGVPVDQIRKQYRSVSAEGVQAAVAFHRQFTERRRRPRWLGWVSLPWLIAGFMFGQLLASVLGLGWWS